MSGATSKVGIQLDWEVAGRDKIIQAVMDSRLYDAELKKLKATSDGSRQSAAQIVDAMIRQADAHRRVRTEMDAVTGAGRKMDATMGAIGASAKQVTSAISTINPQIGGLVSGIEGVLATGVGVGGVLAASTAVVAGLGVASLLAAKSIGDFQQHMDNISETTGLTSKEIGGLTIAAINANQSFESITPTIDIFVRKLGEARQGVPEAVSAFKAVGVAGADLDQAVGTILQQVGQHLDSIQDPARRAADASGVFSRGWHQVLPVITQDLKENGQTAERWGVSLSGSAQKAAREANIEFDKLGARFTGFTNQLKASQAESGAGWAKWATGVIDWWEKIDQKIQSSAMLRAMTGRGTGAMPGLSGRQAIDFDDETGTTAGASPSNLAAAGLSEDQQKAVDAIADQIAGYDRLRAAIRMSIPEEVQALSKLEEQAIAMKDQVVAARELLMIRRQMASLLGQQGAQFGPAIPKDVQQRLDFEGLPNKNPMPTPDVNLEPFGGSKMDRLFETTADEVEKFSEGMKGLDAQFHLSGDESLKFARLVQTHQQEIAAAYAVSDAAGMKAAKHFSDQAKQQQKEQDLDKSAAEAGKQAVRDLVHSAVTDMEHFWSAAANIIEQAIQRILEAAILSAIPIPGLAGGGTIGMAHGGMLAIPAKHGLMLSGVRGRDTIPIMAQKGEKFVSTADTDDDRAFRGEMRQQMAQLMREGVGGGGDTYNIDIPVYANYVDESTMNTHVERVLIPAIQRATGKKGHRGH